MDYAFAYLKSGLSTDPYTRFLAICDLDLDSDLLLAYAIGTATISVEKDYDNKFMVKFVNKNGPHYSTKNSLLEALLWARELINMHYYGLIDLEKVT